VNKFKRLKIYISLTAFKHHTLDTFNLSFALNLKYLQRMYDEIHFLK